MAKNKFQVSKRQQRCRRPSKERPPDHCERWTSFAFRLQVPTFSINFTASSVVTIDSLLSLTNDERLQLLWIGCAIAPEVISIAIKYPKVQIAAVDKNQLAIERA